MIESQAPKGKKQKLNPEADCTSNLCNILLGANQCLHYIINPNATSDGYFQRKVASTLEVASVGKIKNDLKTFRKVFDNHDFRTSIVASPRQALSVYKDSCVLESNCDEKIKEGKVFLLCMMGCHPNQTQLEQNYSTSIRPIYCLVCYCHRLLEACPKAFKNETFSKQLLSIFQSIHAKCLYFIDANAKAVSKTEQIRSDQNQVLKDIEAFIMTIPDILSQIKSILLSSDTRIRLAQLDKEYDRVWTHNCTYANAHMHLFLSHHSTSIKDIYLKPSPHNLKYERITIYLYDPQIDHYKPIPFTFLPSLPIVLQSQNDGTGCGGVQLLVNSMIESFWKHLLRQGYFATKTLQEQISPELKSFFRSGISREGLVPFQLNAHFDPEYPFSLYLYGSAGAGKSSFVQHFAPALHTVLEECMDSALLVRFVKQNLNKPMVDLKLEFELRPNNNDLSVMSIIQGRRMTLTQTKPGLVVAGMEEMAAGSEFVNDYHRHHPGNENKMEHHQYEIAQLMSQRFAGRLGDFQKEEKKAPRNSGKRGISGDASLITLFTSNYPLESLPKEALQRLEMFKNLKCIRMSAVDKDDRVEFAKTYLTQCINDQLQFKCKLHLDIPVGRGDTRPLVKELRMISFFVCHLVRDYKKQECDKSNSIEASIVQDSTKITTVECKANGTQIQLKYGLFGNLYPVITTPYSDERVLGTLKELKDVPISSDNVAEFSQVLDFYFAKTLAPAVIVSQDDKLIQAIMDAVSKQKDISSIKGIDPDKYKIMKSLYDPSDTPNLRDDILQYGKGAYVAAGLTCSSTDAQMAIREIIEDTPSMTAFSTSKSALYKSGLFFAISITGEISPEVRSRASIIL